MTEPLGPIVITPGAWYRLTYEDRQRLRVLLDVGIGAFYGELEDAVRESALSTRTQNILLERLGKAVRDDQDAQRAGTPVQEQHTEWGVVPTEAGPPVALEAPVAGLAGEPVGPDPDDDEPSIPF
jgi:hypothetical protein